MQAIWKGSISFGLVNIPVKVFSATTEKDISFRQVHIEDGGRIRYKRVCEIDGEEIPYSDIGKGYEMPDGRMVVLTNDDFKDLPLSTKKSIEVLEFVPADQVDPIYLGKSYYLGVDGKSGDKPYVLLRKALEDSSLYALVKIALRSRESLALLRVKDDVLVLQAMLWPDEIRTSAEAAPDDDVEVAKQELTMAKSYIDALKADFDPEQYSDEYREALEKVVAAKAEGVPIPEDEETSGETAQVVDLVAALRASVAAAKAKRSGGSAGAASADGAEDADGSEDGKASKPAAKKTAKKSAKKSATKKTAKKSASDTTSKKTAAKKSA